MPPHTTRRFTLITPYDSALYHVVALHGKSKKEKKALNLLLLQFLYALADIGINSMGIQGLIHLPMCHKMYVPKRHPKRHPSPNGTRPQTAQRPQTAPKRQSYMIESVLMQCIGRARLINNPDRKVLLLSNFILPQAKVLNYSNQEIKELMEN